MTNSTPTIAWICLAAIQVEAAAALLEDARQDTSPPQPDNLKVYVGTIGLAHVVVFHTLTSLSIADVETRVETITPHLQTLQAVVITGRIAQQSPDACPGDLFISPSSQVANGPDASARKDLVQCALRVLHGETGDDGSWLSTNHPQSESPASVIGERDTANSPRLHYLQDFDQVKRFRVLDEAGLRFWDNKSPTVVVLGIDDVESSGRDLLVPNAALNTASYAKELIQLMADPSVREIPTLEGTEKVVPAPPAPQLPPFPLHQYPTHGNEVLLVIPTENDSKKAIIRECIGERNPTGLKVHTITVPVESNAGEQPYNKAGALGAYHRVSNALARLHGAEFAAVFAQNRIGTVMAVSIENYIQTQDVDRPADFAIGVVHNATTNRTGACASRGVTLPPEYVRRARRFGNDGDEDHGKITVGQVLAARVPGLDKANWHAVLAGCSRYDLLKEALRGMPIPW